jgi:hypothetical protein
MTPAPGSTRSDMPELARVRVSRDSQRTSVERIEAGISDQACSHGFRHRIVSAVDHGRTRDTVSAEASCAVKDTELHFAWQRVERRHDAGMR